MVQSTAPTSAGAYLGGISVESIIENEFSEGRISPELYAKIQNGTATNADLGGIRIKAGTYVNPLLTDAGLFDANASVSLSSLIPQAGELKRLLDNKATLGSLVSANPKIWGFDASKAPEALKMALEKLDALIASARGFNQTGRILIEANNASFLSDQAEILNNMNRAKAELEAKAQNLEDKAKFIIASASVALAFGLAGAAAEGIGSIKGARGAQKAGNLANEARTARPKPFQPLTKGMTPDQKSQRLANNKQILEDNRKSSQLTAQEAQAADTAARASMAKGQAFGSLFSTIGSSTSKMLDAQGVLEDAKATEHDALAQAFNGLQELFRTGRQQRLDQARQVLETIAQVLNNQNDAMAAITRKG